MMNDMTAFGMELAVRSTLVLMAATIGAHLLRGRPAVERHLLWVIATCGVLAQPLIGMSVPAWRVPVESAPWLAALRTTAATPAPAAFGSVVGSEAAAAPVAEFSDGPAAGLRTTVDRGARSDAEGVPSRGTETVAATRNARATPVPAAIILLIWLAGAIVVAGALALSFFRVHRLASRARVVSDPALLAVTSQTRSELGLRRPVKLLEGDVDTMPMTFGLFRSSLLLPSIARDWPIARQRAVLRHELAHIARRDAWTQLAAELCCALHWYNPLVWLAARRLHLEREHACDDVVLLAAGSRPTEYAAELIEIARTMRAHRGTAIAAVAMARDSQLRSRTLALLDGRRRSAHLSRRLRMPAWLGGFALITTLTSLAPDHAQPVSDGPRSIDARRLPATVFTAGAGQHTITAPLSPAAEPWPPAPLPSPAAPIAPDLSGTDCLADNRSNSLHSNSTNTRRTIKWSGRDCSGEVIVEGDVEFDASFTTITGISRGGQFRIDVTEGRDRRQLVIRPANGGLTHEYRLNGQRAEFDAAAQRWLDEQLLFLFRRVGFMGEQRARALLARGGPGAVLAEVDNMQSDHSRAAYLGVAVSEGRLDEASLHRVLTIAGTTLSSDHYRTNVITAAAGRYSFTDGMRTSYIDAVSGLSSDHYRHAAFSALLEKGQLSPVQVSAVLNETGRLKSDHYRAQLLGELGNRYGSMPEIRSAYLRAAADISSDHYKHVVLSGLLENTSLSAAEQTELVQAAATIRSDHYRRQLLGGVVSERNLSPAVLAAVLNAARTIRSDHYKSELLIEIADTHSLDAATRDLMLDVMEGMRSSGSRGRVAEALLRSGR